MEYLSRVEDCDGATVHVAAPLGGSVEPPELGTPMSLRWSAGVRGRWRADARLDATVRPKNRPILLWNLTLLGKPVVDQRRRYVRAGGGEPAVIAPRFGDAIVGQVVDVSEGGVRCRVPYAKLLPDQPIEVTVDLDDDKLVAEAWVLRTVENHGGQGVDVIALFDLPERDADLVRQYVMRQQIRARRAAAEAAG